MQNRGSGKITAEDCTAPSTPACTSGIPAAPMSGGVTDTLQRNHFQSSDHGRIAMEATPNSGRSGGSDRGRRTATGNRSRKKPAHGNGTKIRIVGDGVCRRLQVGSGRFATGRTKGPGGAGSPTSRWCAMITGAAKQRGSEPAPRVPSDNQRVAPFPAHGKSLVFRTITRGTHLNKARIESPQDIDEVGLRGHDGVDVLVDTRNLIEARR
jgi:hypothetical protein